MKTRKLTYDFKPEDAERFAQSVNARVFAKGNEMVFISCPYCHGGKNRDKNTFSINLKTGKNHCFRSECSVTAI